MRNEKEYKGKVMWIKNPVLDSRGIKFGRMKLPTGVECTVCVGRNEDGWEHVSVELYARRLPTWEEMCYVKDMFWEDEEEVVQIHPKHSHYVNITEALHLWRPVNGDWGKMNDKGTSKQLSAIERF